MKEIYKSRLIQLKREIDEYLNPVESYQSVVWKKLRLEFNFHSNHIEGNTLTYGETQLLLFYEQVTGENNFRFYQEMQAHDVALSVIVRHASDSERPLTEKFMRELNEIILVQPFFKDALTPSGDTSQILVTPGAYKKNENFVKLQNGEIHKFPTPAETPILMNELIEWYQKNKSTDLVKVVEVASELHYKLVAIHPFEDGNGRVARLLANFIFLENNLPIVVIPTNEKPKYLTSIYYADTGDLEHLYDYFAQKLIKSLEITLLAMKGESVEDEDDWMKELKLLKERNYGKEVTQLYNEETIEKFIQNDFQKLLNSLYDGLNVIDDMFFIVNRKIRVNNSYDVKNSDSYADFAYKIEQKKIRKIVNGRSITEIVPEKQKQEVKLITITIDWQKFKFNETQTFNIKIHLYFEFNDFNFDLKMISPDKTLLTKLYGKTITEEEIKLIVNSLGSIITEQIKNNLGI